MQLRFIDISLCVVRLDPSHSIPIEVWNSSFLSITRTDEEISIVCDEGSFPDVGKVESGYGLIKIIGPLDFSMTGVLASLLNPLSDAEISVFCISTYDTDYILVKNDQILRARNILGKLPDVDIVN